MRKHARYENFNVNKLFTYVRIVHGVNHAKHSSINFAFRCYKIIVYQSFSNKSYSYLNCLVVIKVIFPMVQYFEFSNYKNECLRIVNYCSVR